MLPQNTFRLPFLLFALSLFSSQLFTQEFNLLKDINPNLKTGSVREAYVFLPVPGKRVFGAIESGDSINLGDKSNPWVTDGTAAGTFRLMDVDTLVQSLTDQHNYSLRYFFGNRVDKVWCWVSLPQSQAALVVTDGTIPGTKYIYKTALEIGNIQFSWTNEGRYFWAVEPKYGDSLRVYMSDGTAQNTGPTHLNFGKTEIVYASGDSLWYQKETILSDTVDHKVYDLYQGNGMPNGFNLIVPKIAEKSPTINIGSRHLASFDDKLIFVKTREKNGVTHDTLHAPGFPPLVLPPSIRFGSRAVIVNQRVVFTAPATLGPGIYPPPQAVYAYDGVSITKLMDFANLSNLSFGRLIVEQIYNDKAYFTDWPGIDSIGGYPLRETDGTVAGTKVFIDPIALTGYVDSSYWSHKVWDKVAQKFYFGTRDRYGLSTQFWVKNLVTGEVHKTGSFHSIYSNYMNVNQLGDKFLCALDDGTTIGRELWVADLTALPTHELTNESIKVSVYPNPAQDNIRVDVGPSNQILAVQVFDLNGQLLNKTEMPNGVTTTQIQLKQHYNGVAIVRVETKQGPVIQKVMLNRN